MLRKFFLAAMCAACVAAPSYADTIRTVINGNTVILEQAPVVYRGSVMVPLQDLVEQTGGRVVYDPVTRSLTACSGSRVINLDLGSTTALIDGRSVPLSAVPVDMGGHVMVPLAFAEEALGADLTWSPSLSTVTLVTAPSDTVVYRTPLVTEQYFSRYSTVEPMRPVLNLPATTSPDMIAMNLVEGQTVPDVFTLQGRTAPNSTVRVTSVQDGAIVRSATSDAYSLANRARDYMTTADSLGFFEVQVDTSAMNPGARLILKVQATDRLGRQGALHRLNLTRR